MKKYLPLVSVSCFVLMVFGLLVVYGCGQVSKAPEEGFSSEGAYILVGNNIKTSGVNTGGTISGKVIQSFTGTAIPGALIFAPSATSGIVSTETNSSGNYTLSGAQIGKIPVTVAKQNYIAITVVCNSSTVNFALYSTLEAPSIPGVGTIEADIRYGGATIMDGHVWGYSENEPMVSHGTLTLQDLDLPAGTVHLSAHAVGLGGTSQVTTLNLSEGETKLVTLEISPLVGTVEGIITPPSGLPDLHISANRFYPGCHILEFGGASIEGTTYAIQVSPSQGDPYLLFLQATTQEAGGWTIPISLIYDPLSISDGQTISSRDYTLEDLPTLIYPSGSISTGTPTFEWSPSGSPNVYFVITGQVYAKWWGFTDETSIQYPNFPAGSEWEIPSTQQSWNTYAVYKSGLDLSNIDLVDLMEGGCKVSRARANTFTKTP